MNLDLYKQLLSFRAISKSPDMIAFRDWLRNYIESNYQGVETYIDDYGNLYVTKGKSDIYNCVIAHLDINQRKQVTHFSVEVDGDLIYGIDESDGERIGLGHDDKIGVYFALKCLEEFDNIKCFFPLDEEIGCIGTLHAEFDFWNDVGFNLQLDRRGSSDVIEYTNGYQVLTEEFKEEISPILRAYAMDFNRGICTDVGEIVIETGIQGCNVSCGYLNEHRDNEVLNIKWYNNAESFGLNLLRYTDGKRYLIS